MSYPLDTDVISELRKPAGRASMNVRGLGGATTQQRSVDQRHHGDADEIGVARLERRDSVQGGAGRKSLVRHLLAAFATRILPVDLVRCSTRVPDPRPSVGAVGICASEHADDSHVSTCLVNPIENAVSTTAGTVPVIQGRTQLFADALRVVEQRTDDERIGSKGHRFGELLRELAAGRGCNDQLVGLITHVVVRLARMAAARLS